MPKKQSSKKRTQVKDLPKKEKKLSTGNMKKVKGGYELKNVQVTSYVVAPKKPFETK